MPDKVFRFELAFDGEAGNFTGVLAGVKTSVRSAVAEIQSITSKAELFGQVADNIKKIQEAFTRATAQAAKFQAEVTQIKNSGGKVGDELAASLNAAEKAAAKASKELQRQQEALSKLDFELKRAGVDTKNLAAEQARLATATQQAAQSEIERQARQTLGIRSQKEINTEILNARLAYEAVRKSGTASAIDIANAQRALVTRTKELNAELTNSKAAAAGFGSSLKSGLSSALLPFVGITAAIAGVVSGFTAAIQAARAFDQSLAEIGAQTKLSKAEIADLGENVRVLAQELGIDFKEAFAGVKELLRSGVPKENVIEVLRLSAEAAKAAVVDVGVGVKASNLLLDAFGATVGELPGLLDKITRGAHEGGASLEEFAKSGGPLLNVARATGQSFDELIAILTVMVSKSGNAERSFADLTKILVKLDTVDTRQKLRAIGIESTNAVEIFQQLAAQGRTLGDVLGLDLAAGGARSAAGIAVLTTNAALVPEKLLAIKDAAGEVKDSVQNLFDSPTAVSQRFNASLDQTALAFGKLFGSGSRFQSFATSVIDGFNLMYLGIRPVPPTTRDANDEIAGLIATMGGVPIPAEAVAASMKATAEATAQAAKEFADAQIKIAGISSELTGLNTSLLASANALQAALTKDIADANARADAQIAALDRSRAAEVATAQATLAIKLKAAQDTFALIVANEKKVTDAVNVAIAAREAAAKRSGEADKKIAADSAAARLATVSQTLSAYQALYAQLITLAQGAAARVQGFEEARIDIAQKIENEIRGIRFAALSGLDQYVARMAEIDRLVSEGRKKAAEGDTAAAKGFFDQAIQESKGLTEVVNKSGVTVITQLQAQNDKLTKLKGIQDASNEAFGEQAQAAKDGATKTIEQAKLIGDEILRLQDKVDTLKATVAEGLALKVELDETSIAKAFAKLDELTQDRTVTVTVRTVNEQGTPVPAPDTGTGFARGGPVRLRRFAGGGMAFRRPGWQKVPGHGFGDTVPAALQAGSFVVRRSASRFYGDGLMSRLARSNGVQTFAGGGTVGKEDIRKYALKEFGFDPFAKGGQFPTGGQFPSGTGGKGSGPATAPLIDPKTGFKTGDSFQTNQPPISFDSRPIPEELITAINVLTYAREMLNAVGQTNPLLGSLLPEILGGITKVEGNPADKGAITNLLRAAETVGSNPYVFAMWGKTASTIEKLTPTWFVDWLQKRGLLDAAGNITGHATTVDISEFAKRFFGLGLTQIGPPTLLPNAQRPSGLPPVGNFRRFAEGGPPGDTVPALLTPGEWVIRRSAVNRFGSGLMHAVNNMQITRESLAQIVAPAAPAVHRFATGGPVGVAASATAGTSTGGDMTALTVNLNANARDIFSRENVRRYLIPELDDFVRRKG